MSDEGFKIADAYVDIKADTSGVGPGVQEHVGRDEGGFFKKSGSIIGGILGANFITQVLGYVAQAGKAMLGEAEDQNAVKTQLAAGIKSTGDASGESVKNIVARSQALSNMSGISRTSIERADSLLLSFQNIKNTPIAPIFDDASTAIANLVARKGGDPVEYATSLGRALNDPVHGLTILTRQGITFTEGQKSSMKAMVDAGNVAGAQGLILDQLKVKFGGSAKAAGETLPGAISRLKNSLTDMGGDMIDKLIPVIVPFFDKLIASVIKLEPELEKMMPSFIKLLPPLTKILLELLPIMPPLLDLVAKTLTTLSPVIEFVAGDLQFLFGMIDEVVKFLQGGLSPKQFLKEMNSLENSTGAFGQMFKWVVDTLTSGVLWLVKQVADLKERWQNGILAMQRHIWIFEQNVNDAIKGVVKWFQSIPKAIGDAFSGAGKWLVQTGEDIINGLVQGIENTIGNVEKTISKGLAGAINGVKSLLGIHSPSTVFADEIGAPIATGIAQGVDKAAGGIQRSIAKATSPSATSASSAAGYGADAAAYSLTAGADGQTILQFAAGAIVLDASNIKDWQDIVDMLLALPQVARSGPGTTKAA